MSQQIGPTLYTPNPVMVCNGCSCYASVQTKTEIFIICHHPEATCGGLSPSMTIDGDQIRTPKWCPVMKERGEV
jgi:hypothetical protein